MKPGEVKPLYVQACKLAHSNPEVLEEKVWANGLVYVDPRDLETAINKHFEANHFMPRVKELLPLARQAERDRQHCASEAKYLRVWRCEKCGTQLCGFLPRNAVTRRRCKGPPQHVGYAFGEVCGDDLRLILEEK